MIKKLVSKLAFKNAIFTKGVVMPLRTSRFSIRDIFALIAMSLFFAGLAIGQITFENASATRTRCAFNLDQIGRAISQYGHENHGGYPRTIYDWNTADKPTWGTGNETAGTPNPFKDPPEKANDQSAALFLLVRTQAINSSAFACPATKCAAWKFGTSDNKQYSAVNWVNWPSAELDTYLSYSIVDLYPARKAVMSGYKVNTSLRAEDPVAADMNPGTSAVAFDSTLERMRSANSMNHNGDGQNVLYGDGHVEFSQTPFCGRGHDNIYTVGGADDAGRPVDGADAVSIGSPASYNDAVMMPVLGTPTKPAP